MPAEKFTFVRHGETRMNLELRCQGRINIPLNETGLVQAKAAAERLADLPVDALYVSPLQRAVQSAEAIAGPRGLEPVPQEWLLEIDHGAVEGLNRHEADEAWPGLFEQWHTRPHTVRFPGGEALDDVARRVAAGLWRVYQSGAGSVLFVTHQVVSGVARCILQGRPLPDLWKDKLVNGQHITILLNAEAVERLSSVAAQQAP